MNGSAVWTDPDARDQLRTGTPWNCCTAIALNHHFGSRNFLIYFAVLRRRAWS